MPRLDVELVTRGLMESRARAQAAIAAGSVKVDGKVITKASFKTRDDMVIQAANLHPWVSRGGVKLAHALDVFKLDVSGMTVLDVGSSTGGFSDVVLSRGADHVYCVDVGTDQLHAKIRADERTTVMEKTDARHLTEANFETPIDLVVCDASFISATKILGTPLGFVKSGGQLVTLVKPQFEVGKGQLGKGGIVKDKAIARDAVSIVGTWIESQGWRLLGDCGSPISGGDGNIEFLIHAKKI